MSARPTACLVVDGYSAGHQFAPALAERGLRAVHVRSSALPHGPLFDAAAYAPCLAHEPRLDALVEAVREVCEPLGVIAGSEGGVELADALAEVLGLPGNGTARSAARRDKGLMLDRVSEAGLRVPRRLRTACVDEATRWAAEAGGAPVVVKPLRSAGSEGVHVCAGPADIARAFEASLGRADRFGHVNGELLVSEYLAGTEYVVNTVSREGRHKLVELWAYRKRLVGGRKLYDQEWLIDFDGDLAAALTAYTHAVLDALGIRQGPSHAEVIVTPDGPVLVEVAARLGGAADIAYSRRCVGHDMVGLTLDSLLAPARFALALQAPNRRLRQALIVDVVTTQQGRVVAERFTERLAGLPSLHKMQFKVRVGERVEPTIDLGTSPVKLHLVHEHAAQIDADYERIQQAAIDGFVVEAR